MNARTVNKVWTGIFYAVAALVVALLVFLVFEILQRDGDFGILISCLENQAIQELVVGLVQLFNSFYMLVITLIISIPLGLGAGIYLAEYAKQGRFKFCSSMYRDDGVFTFYCCWFIWFVSVRYNDRLGIQ